MHLRMNGSRDRKPQTPTRPEHTSISFTSEDLIALARLIQAGQVLLQDEQRPPVVSRIKAAMTRLGVPIPSGL